VPFRSLEAATAWLESHVDYELVPPNRQGEPSLEPIVATLAAIGDPQLDYPAVHVTGTNGKGTTTTLTTALLSTLGQRVGTFTSPDLHGVTERIAVAGGPINDDDFTALLGRLADAERATGIVLTRFEILTVGAFLHFSDEGVDAAVVEVGVGGTWDSTNVIDGAVSVLTNVSLDHVAVLGNSIEAIAADKVGIFKSGAVAVVGTQDPVVGQIAGDRVRRVGGQLLRRGEQFELTRNDVAVGGRLVTISTPRANYEDVYLSLHGVHQGDNAATALVATEAFLGGALEPHVVHEAYGHAAMPGRLELLSRRPMVVVDGAHNPAGVRALVGSLDGAFHVDGARRCVLGILSGRNVDDMVAPLVAAGFVEFYCCPPSSPRAVDPKVVADAVRAHGGVAIEFPSVGAALAHAREHASDDDLIVATGSLYLVAEVRAIVLKVPHRH
jgi:dihydrofolate synthase / folylpolyglutamate synthase